MTTKELQGVLLTHYLFAIEMVKNARGEEWRDVISEAYVDMGVCRCASMGFGHLIYRSKWVRRHSRITSWARFTLYAHNRKQALQLLQVRVHILQKELSLQP